MFGELEFTGESPNAQPQLELIQPHDSWYRDRPSAGTVANSVSHQGERMESGSSANRLKDACGEFLR